MFSTSETSSIYSPATHQPFNSNEQTKIFTPEKVKACADMLGHFRTVAIKHVYSVTIKSLVIIKRFEYTQARNRVDVPHGLFGFSLKDFFERRKQNTVYIDVLRLVSKKTLNQVKMCIVLDNLLTYIERLFEGFKSNNTGKILKEIDAAKQALDIGDVIRGVYKMNQDLLVKLQEQEREFNFHERNDTFTWNSRIWSAQNANVDAQLLLDPIEFRYRIHYHESTIESFRENLIKSEEELKQKVSSASNLHSREVIVNGYVMMKQKRDLDILKGEVDRMSQKYNSEYERYDSETVYYKNAIEAMSRMLVEQTAMMGFYEHEIINLKAWHQQRTMQRVAHKKKSSKGKKKNESAIASDTD